MINNCSFFPTTNVFNNIKPAFSSKISFKGINYQDTFIKTSTKLDESLQYAKQKIIDALLTKGIEYGVAISHNGEILQEAEGDENHCTFDSRKISPNAIVIHGHPKSNLPLSSGDISSLLCSNAITEEAITADGKFSRLSKKSSFNLEQDYREVYQKLEKQLREMVLDELGIDYKLNFSDIINMAKDYLSKSFSINKENITDDYTIRTMKQIGIDISKDNIKQAHATLCSMLSLYYPEANTKFDKSHNAIIENQDAIENYLSTPEGIETRHNFIREVSKKYDLIYETNMQ